ncbi:hypothetical protein BCR39DRAFT_218935 [Naematelia encephala]|uniref:Uncharacterized protein n=1 Tax=Naematelia encephala TaxID=71784 RepID=A0A1Y2B110_9TREE|nr:hypothetical protein BCR39DRAFT_218935 [Naematelia encephala]
MVEALGVAFPSPLRDDRPLPPAADAIRRKLQEEAKEVSNEVQLKHELASSVLPVEVSVPSLKRDYSFSLYEKYTTNPFNSNLPPLDPVTLSSCVETSGWTTGHDLIYTRWEDHERVTRTRSHLQGKVTARPEHRRTHPSRLGRLFSGTWFPRQTVGPFKRIHEVNEGTAAAADEDQEARNRLDHPVMGFVRNRSYVPLDPRVKDALVSHSLGRGEAFIEKVLSHGLPVTGQLLNLINRGPLFTPWMLKYTMDHVIAKVVTRGIPDPHLLRTASYVFAHYFVNYGAELSRNLKGERIWETDTSSTASFNIPTLKQDPFACEVFDHVRGAVAPATGQTLEQKSHIAALTIAITHAGACRAAKQKDVDNNEHAYRVGMVISFGFAAMKFVAGASPIPLLGSGLGAILGLFENAISDRNKKKYSEGILAGILQDQLNKEIIELAISGQRIPGMVEVPDEDLAQGNPTGDERRVVGNAFVADLQEYLKHLDEIAPVEMARI